MWSRLQLTPSSHRWWQRWLLVPRVTILGYGLPLWLTAAPAMPAPQGHHSSCPHHGCPLPLAQGRHWVRNRWICPNKADFTHSVCKVHSPDCDDDQFPFTLCGLHLGSRQLLAVQPQISTLTTPHDSAAKNFPIWNSLIFPTSPWRKQVCSPAGYKEEIGDEEVRSCAMGY